MFTGLPKTHLIIIMQFFATLDATFAFFFLWIIYGHPYDLNARIYSSAYCILDLTTLPIGPNDTPHFVDLTILLLLDLIKLDLTTLLAFGPNDTLPFYNLFVISPKPNQFLFQKEPEKKYCTGEVIASCVKTSNT